MEFEDEIKEAASNYDIPAWWIAAIVDIESDFDPEARRYEEWADVKKDEQAGAFKRFEEYSDLPNQDDKKWENDASYGLGQIMGDTALWLGWKPGSEKGFEELYDVKTNLDLVAKYLSHLYSKYPEITSSKLKRVKMATAAYNAGRGNINKMLRIARQEESEAEGRTITIDDKGKWQNWDYSKQYLKRVTGENAEITKNYLKKFNRLRTKYEDELEDPKDAPVSKDERLTIEEINKGLVSLRDRMNQTLVDVCDLIDKTGANSQDGSKES